LDCLIVIIALSFGCWLAGSGGCHPGAGCLVRCSELSALICLVEAVRALVVFGCMLGTAGR